MSVSGSTSAFAGAKNLGSCPLQISRMGYGAWPLSYAERPDEATALAVLHRALDNGVRFIDTSDAYCKDESEKHHNERLIRKALASYPDQAAAQQVIVATKGICVRPEGRWERCATPEQIKKAIAGSHEALCGKEKPIDLWQIHWCQVRATAATRGCARLCQPRFACPRSANRPVFCCRCRTETTPTTSSCLSRRS